MSDALSQSYQVFFENAKEAMYISTREGRFRQVNKAFAKLIGMTVDELLATRVEATLALPAERRRFRSEIEANGLVSGFELQLLSKANEAIPCLVDSVVIRDILGEVDGYIGMVRPVKALAKAEDKEKPFDLALRGSNDGLWEWDLRKKSAYWSPRWKSLLGYGAAELRDDIQEWFDRVHPDDINSLKQGLSKYLQGGDPGFQSYHRVKHRNGEWQWMLIRWVGDFGDDGKCRKIGGSFSNVTAHIRMLEKLKTQENKLAEMNSTLASDKALLTRFFSGDVLAQVLQSGDGKPGSAKIYATILQLHINNIEGLWTKIGPEQYTNFLNEILTDLMDLVYSHSGSVSKILGDTLVCSFSSVVPGQKEEVQAVRCVKAIKAWLGTYNDVRPAFLKAPLTLCMGIASGDVLNATLGSVHRLELTLMGPPLVKADQLQKEALSAGVAVKTDASIPAAVWD